jgi:hypothetical protein
VTSALARGLDVFLASTGVDVAKLAVSSNE